MDIASLACLTLCFAFTFSPAISGVDFEDGRYGEEESEQCTAPLVDHLVEPQEWSRRTNDAADSYAETETDSEALFFEAEKKDEPHSIWTADQHQDWVGTVKANSQQSGTAVKWKKYLQLITESLRTYIPCGIGASSNLADCFAAVIDFDLQPFENSDGITLEMTERAIPRGVLYQIIGHRIFRQKECLFPARCSGVEHFLLRHLADLPDFEFVVNVRDNPQVYGFEQNVVPVFSFSKTDQYQDILYPAWTFWEGGPAIASYPRGLGRWDLMRDKIAAAADKFSWDTKLPLGFFRGSRTSDERDPLILLSRAKPDLVDAKYTKNQAWRSERDSLGESPAPEVPLEDHCKYKYLFNFRGIAASFRFKHLFICESVVFHVGADWIEFFYPAMKPWVHYIPVRTDLSDVEELLEFARENDAVVRDIAARGKEFIFRHLKMENVDHYWGRLLRNYSALIHYPVQKRANVVPILP